MTIDIEVVTLALAVIGALGALFQWRRDQAWKRAEKLDSLYKEFMDNELLQIACKVMDWNRGNFSFPSGYILSYDSLDVEKSLFVHGHDKDLTFTQVQVKMREAYDAFLSFLERLEVAISAGLVSERPATSLFGYWVCHFADMPEHPECKNRSLMYVTRYGNKGSFHVMYWRVTKRSLEQRFVAISSAAPNP